MDRLTEKLNKVAGIAGRITSKLEERCDFMLERETAIDGRSERIFSAKHAILDDAEKGLDAVEAHLQRLSNDPLPSSGDSSAGSEFEPTHPGREPQNPPAPVVSSHQPMRDGVVMIPQLSTDR